MSELAGGFSKDDIAAGFDALRTAQSNQDLDRAIESMPVLRAPIFHAQLRQYRLRMQSEFAKYPQNFANFMSMYDTFFMKLHYRAYFREKNPASTSPPEAGVTAFAPAFFLELSSILGDRIPPLEGPTYNPAKDAAAITQELQAHLKKKIELQPWQPAIGSRWGAIVMGCLACKDLRLALRAQLVDLTSAPELLDVLEQKSINNDRCLSCGAQRSMPVRVWIQEQPGPTDPLGATSWICRARPTEAIYLPPPGTVRNPDYDRILEIRLEMLLRQLSSDPLRGDDSPIGVQTNGVAYTLDELLWRLHSISRKSAATVAYEDIVQNITERLQSGIMPLYQTEQMIRQSITQNAKEWPLITAAPAGNLIEALVRNLIAEACAEAQGVPPAVRANLAGLVVQCYTGLGELGLAETNLARAQDLLAKSPDDTSRKDISLSLLNVKAELLSAQGRHQEAEQLRRQVLESRTFDSGSLESRLARQAVMMNTALDARKGGRLAEALEGIEASLKGYEALETEARAKAGNSAELAEIRHGVSGATANLGMIYSDVANNHELIECLGPRKMKYEELPLQMRRQMQRIGSAQAYMTVQAEMIERVRPLLEREFPNGYDYAALMAQAKTLLSRALVISDETGSYDYAAIQSYTLAQLLDDTGESQEAGTMMESCLRYAARVTDYYRMSAASWYLAEAALAKGDGARGLELLRNCLRFDMREFVRRGSEYQPGRSLRIAYVALGTVASGGDPLDAILVAESAKALSTAISLSRGVPLQAAAGTGGAGTTGPLKDLLNRRESLRIKAMWNRDEGPALEQQLTAVEREIDTARRELSLRDERFARWHDATYLEVTEARTIRRILGEAGENATFAGFIVYRDSVYTYAVWNGGQIVEQRALPAALQGTSAEQPESLLEPAIMDALGALLLEPLLPRLAALHPQDRLFLSPYDPFDQRPFSLIPYGGKPLCQQVTLSMTYGIGVLEASAERAFLPLKQALCIGAPARPDVPELPHAKEEIDRLGVLFDTAQVAARPALTGRDATVAALSKRIGGCDLVHFACHATGSRAGSGAQLLLAPDLIARDSGVLSEDRIVSSLVLKPGCHVNMAGCQTGVGEGESQFYHRGLIPAFLVAGAGSVIGSLWMLEDGPAARFQALYYQRLIAGTHPSAALAETQRDCIAGKLGEDMKRPANWAAYLLYGMG